VETVVAIPQSTWLRQKASPGSGDNLTLFTRKKLSFLNETRRIRAD